MRGGVLTAIDEFLPVWEFRERHEIRVRATAERVESAVRAVTLAELPVARLLFALRSLPGRLRTSSRERSNPREPLLEEMRAGGFVLLAERPGEIVLGRVGDFARLAGPADTTSIGADEFTLFDRPGWCKAVIDFRIDASAGGCVLSTETRVHAPDIETRRRFRRYWLVIRPFSGLIRILFLRAARRRAEATRVMVAHS